MRRDPIGIIAYGALIGTTLLAFYGLAGFEDTSLDLSLLSDPYVLQILKFSLTQAFLSAVLSVFIALPIARYLYRRSPPGGELFLKLCLLAFVMPTLVVITATILILGPQGLLRPVVGGQWSVYGLQGILIAHVYLNMPLAVRVLTQQYRHLPDRTVLLARQLKFSGWDRFRLIEFPSLAPTLFALLGLIFVLCFNSFAIVLALGGGPAATTFELAIYQALKYDFNLSEALTLAWMQFAIAGLLFVLISARSQINWLGSSRDSGYQQPDISSISKPFMSLSYWLAWLFLLAPLIALLLSVQSRAFLSLDLTLISGAVLRSLLLALGATVGATLLSLALMKPIQRAVLLQNRKAITLLTWLSTHTLVAPAMVLSTGIYIFLLPRTDLETWGVFWLVILNLVILVPFLLSQLRPRLLQYDQQYGNLIKQLKLSRWDAFVIRLPYIRTSLISAFALGLLLAIGDLSIFAIFGNYESPTLPWLIYRYAGNYRMEEATIASLLLLLICLVLLIILERQKPND